MSDSAATANQQAKPRNHRSQSVCDELSELRVEPDGRHGGHDAELAHIGEVRADVQALMMPEVHTSEAARNPRTNQGKILLRE